MSESVCRECGCEMPYDWAPCPQCGWKAPDPWEMEAESDEEGIPPGGLLSKPRSWIRLTVWILMGGLVLGFAMWFLHHS